MSGHPPTRKSPRKRGFDYATPGVYFVTACIQYRRCVLGEVKDGNMELSPAGRMVSDALADIPHHSHNTQIELFAVLPNHIHALIWVAADPELVSSARFYESLDTVMQKFKSYTTNRYIAGVREDGWPPFRRRLWQQSYHDHIVRSESSLVQIRGYIVENARRWEMDRFNPTSTGVDPIAKQLWQQLQMDC